MAKADTPKKPRRKNHALRVAALAATLGLSVIIGLAATAYFFVIPQAENSRQTTISALIADQQAQFINSAITQLLRSTGDVSKGNSIALILRDEDGLHNGRPVFEVFKDNFMRAFPEALDVALIPVGPLGSADPDNRHLKQLNSIELDILRRTIENKSHVVDAYKLDKDSFVSIAHWAPAGAVLLIKLPAQHFKALLKSSSNGQTQTRLIQNYKRAQHIIAVQSSPRPSGLMASRDLQLPHWSLEVTLDEETLESFASDTKPLWAAAVIAALLMLSCCFFIALKINRSLNKDLDTVLAVLRGGNIDALEKQEMGLAATQEFSETLGHELQHNLRRLSDPHSTAAEETAFESGELLVQEARSAQVPGHIFRAYDIRGVADTELNDDNCAAVAAAIAESLRGDQRIALGRDGRLSSPRIHQALCKGLRSAGVTVMDFGEVATPMLHFARQHHDLQHSAMITGSHNPAEDNGIKLVLNKLVLSPEDIQQLYLKSLQPHSPADDAGEYSEHDIFPDYLAYIRRDIRLRSKPRLVIDGSNGATSNYAPALFEALGCEVITLHCSVDGNFPNHPPDPTVAKNLTELISAVQTHGADIGIAFDGDGDRMVAVSAQGRIAQADETLVLLAQDALQRCPNGAVVYDVKSSRHLRAAIEAAGGEAVMSKSGHSHMKVKMAETQAPVGAEFSGHYFFNERWFGFDDGLYAAARLLEVLDLRNESFEQALAAIPSSISTGEIKIPVEEQRKFALMEELLEKPAFENASISTLDGLRADFNDGWGLVRASNTSAALTLRFEADNQEALDRIQKQFAQLIKSVDNSLPIRSE